MAQHTGPVARLLHLAGELTQRLFEERTALTEGDVPALLCASDNKRNLVRQLEDCGRQLVWNELPAQTRTEAEAALSWCRKQNLANAALLEARRAQVQWALGFLGVSSATLYGRSGAAVASFAARSVGMA